MATKVRVLSANFSKDLAAKVKARAIVDFGLPPQQRQVLGKQFDASLEQAVDRLLDETIPSTVATLREDYANSLDAVGDILDRGIKQNQILVGSGYKVRTSFDPLTPKYVREKVRYGNGTDKLFWKFTGRMAQAYRSFAAARKSGLSRAKAERFARSRTYKAGGRKYSYRIDYTLPAISRATLLDDIFRLSYIVGAEAGRRSSGLTGVDKGFMPINHRDQMSIIAMNEAIGYESTGPRPFIAELLSQRGGRVRAKIVDQLQRRWVRSRRG